MAWTRGKSGRLKSSMEGIDCAESDRTAEGMGYERPNHVLYGGARRVQINRTDERANIGIRKEEIDEMKTTYRNASTVNRPMFIDGGNLR